MTDTPKFEVIDRRKMKAMEEQQETQGAPAPIEEAPKETKAGPQLVEAPPTEPAVSDESEAEIPDLPPPPTADETRQQKSAYDASAQRVEDLARAQNPAMGAVPPVGFEHLVQQLYLSAMIQLGAGTQEGQRPRIDILGARQTIDMLGVLAEKTKGNLTDAEDRALQTVLFDVRMAFLEITNMITLQGVPAPPPQK